MKNQFNRIYIFCTFRGQLVFLVAFIIVNLSNVANYAYTEGCGNIFGETVGLYAKFKEDPNFIPELTTNQKTYLLEEYYKEKAAFEGKELPAVMPEKIHINKPAFLFTEPNVVPVKTLYSLIKDDLNFKGLPE
jgi:hypothetical protein